VTRYDCARSIAGRGWYWTACYRIGETLVDAGCAHTALELVEALRGVRIRRVLITHSHEDHIGAIAALRRVVPDLQVFAHPSALPILEDPAGMLSMQRYRRVFWGRPERVLDVSVLRDADVIEAEGARLVAIHTPGHSADHLCFFEPESGALFSGDLYIGGKDRALRKGYRIREILRSLRKVQTLPFRRLFPGSARVPGDPHAAIAQKVGYLEDLGERILDLHRNGSSVHEIARRLLGPPGLVERFTLGNFSRVWLVRSYLESYEPVRETAGSRADDGRGGGASDPPREPSINH